MNSENSKRSDRHILLLSLRDKIDLRRKGLRTNLSIYYIWKNIKRSY